MGKKQKPKPQRKRRQQQRQKKKELGFRQEGIPVDVIQEILLKSQVKTLGKLRCVCKQWGSIISQPSFQEDHHQQCYQANPYVLLTRCEFNGVVDTETNGVVDTETNGVVDTETKTLHLSTYTSEGTFVKEFYKTISHQSKYNYIPVQSCLGLVCLAPRFSANPILVCNPSTEELVALPSTQRMHTCVGFGYATSTKQFKVVRFFRHPEFEDTQLCCEVFTVGISGWREVGTTGWREAWNPPPQYPPNFFTSDAPFLHGALHLLHELRLKLGDADSSIDEDADSSIDVFDIETEAYTKIPLPECFRTVESSLHTISLKEFEGSLCLTFHFPWILEFWCLNYYNREWVKKYSICLDSLGVDSDCLHPLKIMGDGNIMLSLFDGDGETLYFYNFRDKTFTKDSSMNSSGTLYVKSSLHLGSR